jgi:hypothetical protein
MFPATNMAQEKGVKWRLRSGIERRIMKRKEEMHKGRSTLCISRVFKPTPQTKPGQMPFQIILVSIWRIGSRCDLKSGVHFTTGRCRETKELGEKIKKGNLGLFFRPKTSFFCFEHPICKGIL